MWKGAQEATGERSKAARWEGEQLIAHESEDLLIGTGDNSVPVVARKRVLALRPVDPPVAAGRVLPKSKSV